MRIEERFSRWRRWEERNQLPDLEYPGVYAIAISNTPRFQQRQFQFCKEIVYIGMSNGVYGVKGRLMQFHNTITLTRRQHGGADRFVNKHRDYEVVKDCLYVSVCHFKCFPRRILPDTLRTMGEVARAEYDCLARCIEEFGEIPEFNSRTSAKYSKSVTT